MVAVCILFFCLSPPWPHRPLLIYLPAVPWSSIWPSPARVPACCPGWPQTPTPDGALRAPRGSATCPSAPVALAPPRALVLPRSATVAAAATRLRPHDPPVLRLPRNPPPTVESTGPIWTRPQAISQPWGNCSARLGYRNLTPTPTAAPPPDAPTAPRPARSKQADHRHLLETAPE